MMNLDYFYSISDNLDFEIFHQNQIYYGNIAEKLKENSLISSVALVVLKNLVQDAVKKFQVVRDSHGENDHQSGSEGKTRAKSYLRVQIAVKLGILPLDFEFKLSKIPFRYTNSLLAMKRKQVALERQVKNLSKSLDETVSILQLHTQMRIKLPKPVDLEELGSGEILEMLNGLESDSEEPLSLGINTEELQSNVDNHSSAARDEISVKSELVSVTLPSSSDPQQPPLNDNAVESANQQIGASGVDTLPVTSSNIADPQPETSLQFERSEVEPQPESRPSSPAPAPATTSGSPGISEMEKRKRDREAQLLKSKQAVKKKKKLF